MATRMSTPPPSTNPRTPDTPRFGYDDDYEPYPRTRAATRQRGVATPVPSTPRKSAQSTVKPSGSKIARPVFTGTAFSGPDFTPPSTVAKNRTFKISRLGDDFTSVPQDVSRDGSKSPTKLQSSTTSRNDIFSTPARTPTQKAATTPAGSMSSISRNLFSSRREDAMPVQRRRNFSRYADPFHDVEEPEIQIYTDSKERIPEKDTGLDNPFYGPGRDLSLSRPPKHKNRVVTKPTRETLLAEVEAEKKLDKEHEQGMWRVFRGKKTYVRFDELDKEDSGERVEMSDELAEHLDASVPTRLRGPVTRSGVKPRLLFPSAHQRIAKAQKEKLKREITTSDEEADTDIEEDIKSASSSVKVVETEKAEKGLKTPRAKKVVAPISPPTTITRVTRSKDVHPDSGVASSFTSSSHSEEIKSWHSRGSPTPHGKKRDHSVSADADTGSHKRARSHAA